LISFHSFLYFFNAVMFQAVYVPAVSRQMPTGKY
jgi:hypothetical protein